MGRLTSQAVAVGAVVAALVALAHTGGGRGGLPRHVAGSAPGAEREPDRGPGQDGEAARYIAHQYRRLLELGAVISAETNVTDACEKLIQAAAGIVGAERVTLLVVDRMSADLYVAASDGPAAAAPGPDEKAHIPLNGATFAGSCAANGRIVNVADTRSDRRGTRPGGQPLGGQAPVPSILCAPVRDRKGRVIAVLEAQQRVRSGPVPAALQPPHSGFSATDEQLISKLAEFSGTALDKLTLFERSEADRHRMHGLVRVMERLASELADVDRLMEAITDAAYSLVSAERVALMMLDEDEQQLVICVSQDARNVRIPVGKGIAGHVARTGETVVVDDVRSDSRFLHDVDRRVGFLTKAVLCVPVWDASRRVVGVIQAINNRQRPDARFSAEDKEVMETLAVTAGIAIRNALLHQEAVQGKETAAAVLSMVAAMAAEDDVERLYGKVLRAVHRLVPSCVSVLYLVDEAEKEVWVACGPGDVIGKRFPLGHGLAGYAAGAGKAVNLADVRTHPLTQGDDPLSASLTALSEQKAWEADHDPVHGAASPEVATAAADRGAVPRRANSSSQPGTPHRTPRSSTRSKARPSPRAPARNRSHSPPSHRRAAAGAAGRRWLAKALATDGAPPPLSLDTSKAGASAGEAGAGPPTPQSHVLGSPLSPGDRRGPSAHAIIRARSQLQSVPTLERRRSTTDLLSAGRAGCRGGEYAALALPISAAAHPNRVLGVVELRGRFGEERFTANDVRALQALLVEVGNVLRTHSVQAAITRVLSKGAATSGNSTVEVEASLLLEYVAGKGHAAAHAPLLRQLSRASRGAGSTDTGDEGESDDNGRGSASPGRGSTLPAGVRASAQWLLDPYYDHFRVGEEGMLQLAVDAFHYFNLPDHFNIPDAKLRKFLSAVRDRYRANPFHNFAHAFSVLQLTFRILIEGRARTLLGSRDVLSLLVAAICHDLEHPGHNNAMEVALGSPLALLHNDDAVLERHHAHTAFVLLQQKKELDLFAGFSSADRAKARRTILQAILATEMGKHFGHVKELLRRAETEEPFDTESADDRNALASAILHTADLGAQALPWPIARLWGDCVLREFAEQARRELALDLPVTKFMEDVDVDELKGLRVQVQFVGNVVEPLFNAMSQILPGLRPMRDQVAQNREQYRKLLDRRKVELAASEDGQEPAAAPKPRGAT